jgi:hypothetical protein
MTRDDIIRMAHQAKLFDDDQEPLPEYLERFAALVAALEQPEQEPVAWMVYTLDGKSVCVTDNPADFGDQHKALPLYAHPPRREWQGLTEDETMHLMNETYGNHWADEAHIQRFRRAIEDALKEKNK